MFPVVTQELALRIGQSETDHMTSWLALFAQQAGNPFGAEIQQFGGTTALFSKAPDGKSLGPLFNRALGFSEADSDHLLEIVAFYRDRGMGCRIDLNPYAASPALLTELASAGLKPFRFHNHLFGLPQCPESSEAPDPTTTPPVTAREIQPDELPIWANIWQRGFLEVSGINPAIFETMAAITSQLHYQPGWSLYMAFVGEAPAAAGALYVQDRVGSLVMGGTVPEYRQRGCQTALLRARLIGAAERGCDIVAAQAALGATSQHNMERAGLRIAYTRAFWLG